MLDLTLLETGVAYDATTDTDVKTVRVEHSRLGEFAEALEGTAIYLDVLTAMVPNPGRLQNIIRDLRVTAEMLQTVHDADVVRVGHYGHGLPSEAPSTGKDSPT